MEAPDVKKMAFRMGAPGGWVFALGSMRRADLHRVPRGDNVPITHHGWFVVNSPDPDSGLAMQRIASALEGKIAQVRRRSDNALGVMVAITNFARLAANDGAAARPLVDALVNKVLKAHDGLAGVILVDHALSREHGPYLGGRVLGGREGAGLLRLQAAVAQREEQVRVIDDWVD